MELKELEELIGKKVIPPPYQSLLKALILEAYGDWDTAHSIAQDIHGQEGAWVHAYLHRKEGDIHNSKYWYSKAGRPFCTATFVNEWDEIVEYLIGQLE